MRLLTKYVLFLAINLTITLCVPALFGVNILSKLSSILPWLIPLLVVLVGLLIGYIISRFIKKDKRDKAFLSGQVISCILFIIFATSESYAGWKHRHFQVNVDNNRDVMRYQVDDNEFYIRSAFKRLEKSFTNPNDFELYSFHVHKQDTIVSTLQDTLYTIYFTYFINANRLQERLAKLTVLQDKVELHFANQLADTSTEYQQLKRAFRNENGKAIEDAERIMKQMKQKGDQSVIDSLTRNH